MLVVIFIIVLSILLLTACGANKTAKEKPYALKSGAYSFEKATITNIITKEVIEKTFDDIINDKIEYKEWGCLFCFSVGINDNTEYFFKKDNRCFVINEGLAYELIGKDTLKLHFPYWQGYSYGNYDIVIILSWQQSY